MVTGVEPTMTTNAASTAPLTTHTKDVPVKSDRRSNKPIMEKRRRARINNCLNELKTLILDYSKKDPARHSKLEKADILEKTVKHLQELQRQQVVMQQAADPKVLNKFKAGFTDCANEVSRFPGIEPSVKRRLLQHLSNCLNGVKSDLPSSHHHSHHNQQRTVTSTSVPMHQMHAQLLPSPPSSPEQDHMHIQHHQHQQQQQQNQQHHQHQNQPQAHASASAQHISTAASHSYIMSSHIQQTPNGYFLPNGLQVIPTKLSNGSIALVLPQGLQKAQQLQMPSSSVPQNISSHLTNIISNGSSNPHIMIPIPSRTASTGSASSNSSSSYEQNMPSPSSSLHYHPPSPNNCYEPMDCKPSIIQHTSSHQMEVMQPMPPQQPLSLVMKKNIKEEDQPWRPW